MSLGFALDHLDLGLGIKQVETISTTHFSEAHYERREWHKWYRQFESALEMLGVKSQHIHRVQIVSLNHVFGE